jgi:DNA-binding SARP family transcriptional activator/TolB-like protein/Tfp pilus assembly protein PilF
MIRLRTLGGVEVTDSAGRDVQTVLAQPKRLVLLTYLALADGPRFRRRDTVVALFWPELDEEHARGALRQALSFLRRALGEDVIVARGEEEIGVDRARLNLDAFDFEAACDAGRPADALGLYQGDFLKGVFATRGAPELEQWVDTERARLRRLAGAAAWRLADEARAVGERRQAADFARYAASFASHDEVEIRRLIELLDAVGDRAGAVLAYESFAGRLAADLGVEPSATTQALIGTVRGRVPADQHAAGELAAAAPDEGAGTHQSIVPERDRRSRLIPVAIALGVLAIAGYVANRSPFRPRRLTVAVLPVEDVGGDTVSLYVANGVTHQLITDLAQIGSLDVISSSTMLQYRGSTAPVSKIASDLGASAVVSGAVQHLGDTVRMTAQLLSADGNKINWAQTFQGTRGDLLRIQRELARAIAMQLQPTLTDAQRAGLARGSMLNPEALDQYVRARHWWNRRGRGGLLQSIQFFNQALDIEPSFALAHSGMADAYVQLGYGSLLRPDDAFPKAREAARRALSYDSTLAEPHATLGYVHMYYDWDWPAAEREFQRALALNPGYATAHEWYGLYLTAMGRFRDALLHERRAQELDPLSVAVAGTAAWTLHYIGRQDDAEREARIALRDDPAFELGHFYLGRILQARGELDSAVAHYAATGRLLNWIPTIAANGYVLALQGRRREAEATLARMDSLAQSEYVTPYAVALVHAALGRTDSAFHWLDRAVEERTHWLVWLRRDTRWNTLRADPRFEALATRVGNLPR